LGSNLMALVWNLGLLILALPLFEVRLLESVLVAFLSYLFGFILLCLVLFCAILNF